MTDVLEIPKADAAERTVLATTLAQASVKVDLVPAEFYSAEHRAMWAAILQLRDSDAPGFWEQNGYHMHGDPWAEQRFRR